MSSFPVEDRHTQYNRPQQTIVIDTSNNMSDNNNNNIEESFDKIEHGEGLKGRQIIRIPVRICASPAELRSAKGIANVFKLSDKMVKHMKLPNTLTNRNGVPLDERVGDPTKTIFTRVTITGKKNTMAEPWVATIDGLKKSVVNDSGALANAYLSAGVFESGLREDISEPNNVATERMLLLHNPLQEVSNEITPHANKNNAYWGLTVKDEHGNTTFSANLLADMCMANKFPQLDYESLDFGDGHDVDVPKEILQRIQQEVSEAQSNIKESLINMYDWSVTFRPANAGQNSPIGGEYTGHSAEEISKIDSETDNIRGELELMLEIEYGMLD